MYTLFTLNTPKQFHCQNWFLYNIELDDLNQNSNNNDKAI